MNGIATQSLGRGEGTTKDAKSTKKETKVVGVRFVTDEQIRCAKRTLRNLSVSKRFRMIPKLENRINRVPQSSSTV
jgi:hypothetical protein